jgi:acetyltransferase
MDLNEGDMLSAIATDPNTHVVAMYMEGVGDGPTFIKLARDVTREKPVVAIKVGRSAAGRAAVASHTGALAGEDAAYDAAFRKAGVIRARHSEEMFDWAQALAWCPLPSGPRIAVLTNAGGPGAIAADALESGGLPLAELTEATRDRLKEFLPPAASLRNPIDMLAGAGPREYADGLRALLADDAVDAVIIILPPPPMTTAAEVAGAIIPVIRLASKPVMVALMGEELIAHAARLFRQSHIPDYRFPERAASAMRVLVERSRQLEAPKEMPPDLEGIQLEIAKEYLDQVEVGETGFLDSLTSAKVVERYGIRIPSEILAETAEQAVEVASQLGYPVALKVVALDVPHKSDFGGVVLDLHSPQDVVEGFENILRMTIGKVPKEKIRGVLVQKMIPHGQDVIVGVVRDDQFGPLVMFGSGGVEVEALGDVAFDLAPLTYHEVEGMVERTWAGRRLRGYRSLPPADRDAVIDVLLRLGQLAVDLPEVVEVEINPLRALPEGSGALALDVRLRLER